MTLEEAVKFAPLATAGIALIAALAAWRAIYVQRDVARWRAALDFFLKTETDEHLIQLYNFFKNLARSEIYRLIALDSHVRKQEASYQNVRSFLNLCELIAVGVKQKTFSERVSYAYWGDVLPQALNQIKPVMDVIRATPGEGTPSHIPRPRLDLSPVGNYGQVASMVATWIARRSSAPKSSAARRLMNSQSRRFVL